MRDISNKISNGNNGSKMFDNALKLVIMIYDLYWLITMVLFMHEFVL